jgi:hypothetical protein
MLTSSIELTLFHASNAHPIYDVFHFSDDADLACTSQSCSQHIKCKSIVTETLVVSYYRFFIFSSYFFVIPIPCPLFIVGDIFFFTALKRVLLAKKKINVLYYSKRDTQLIISLTNVLIFILTCTFK